VVGDPRDADSVRLGLWDRLGSPVGGEYSTSGGVVITERSLTDPVPSARVRVEETFER
jgi:hypothetical protein